MFNKIIHQSDILDSDLDISKIPRYSSLDQIIQKENKLLFFDSAYLNDFDPIDDFLAELNSKTCNTGFIIIKYKKQPIASIKNINSILHFIFKRALPKVPVFNKIYDSIFNNKNKSLSQAEAWGRLMFAGFDIISEQKLDDSFYLLCKKINSPNKIQKPSFYPIIRLNRVGYKGKIIKIYKFRTMYPYSEFLQKKVFEMNNLSDTGKFQNDFRITEYGKFIRKIWIDELPQILNLLKHDIKLVGVRAMSEHYFSLYPEEYKKLYKKVRPGFLSPLYENTTFECIVETEKKYLEEYLEHPLKTDIKYFFKIIFDILKGKRSS